MYRASIQGVVDVPLKLCFMDLTQLNKFMKQLNQICSCTTPGCKGELTSVHVKSAELGGAVSIGYTRNGCVGQRVLFETSYKYELTSTSDISIAVQVAFIVASCTHMTYYKNTETCTWH